MVNWLIRTVSTKPPSNMLEHPSSPSDLHLPQSRRPPHGAVCMTHHPILYLPIAGDGCCSVPSSRKPVSEEQFGHSDTMCGGVCCRGGSRGRSVEVEHARRTRISQGGCFDGAVVPLQWHVLCVMVLSTLSICVVPWIAIATINSR